MKDNVISVYNSIADKYSKLFPGKNKFIDLFTKMLPKNARVLDVGCGAGEDTKYLLSKEFRVESIDASKNMIFIARKNLPQQRFSVKDMRKINYRNDTFNGIVAAFSIIHLKKKDAINIIKKFHKIVKFNGVVYLALQEGKGEKIITEPLNPGKKIFVNFYTVLEIKNILKTSGFKIVLFKKGGPVNKYAFLNKKLFIIARKVSK
ncbi:MAG: class I SAM-dependent methyltransferase [Candidatus Aenigmarchaeota archaeon]|nr:class I SAM-dependent methyltransferase [Candidatus Aenigmarchaeota archaeon]